jgi:hypothetical protein
MIQAEAWEEEETSDGEESSDGEELGDDEEIAAATIERLSDVDGWELYRLLHETGSTICTFALRATEARTVDYALWYAADAMEDEDEEHDQPANDEELGEPRATGTLTRTRSRAWDDQAREAALREICERYEIEADAEIAEVFFAIATDSSADDD